MSTAPQPIDVLKQRDNLPGYDHRMEAIQEYFIEPGILDRPRSIKPETLAEKTDGFTIAEIETMANEAAESEKIVNVATVNKHVRLIAAALEEAPETEEEPASAPEVAAEPAPEPKIKAEPEFEPEPEPKKNKKNEYKIEVSKLEKISVPNTEIVVVVDATRNMRHMENAIEQGLSKIFGETAKYDGVKVHAILLGKDNTVIEQTKSAGIKPHKHVECHGKADILDEFIRIMRNTRRSQKKISKKKRLEKTIIVLIADMTKIGKGELSAESFRKKVQKRRRDKWDIIISAYGLSDKDAKKREIDPDEVIEFDREDAKSVVSAFSGVASMIDGILSPLE